MNALSKILFILLATTTLSATEVVLELVDVKSVMLSGEKEPQNTVFTGETFKLKATIKNADSNTGDIKIDGLEKLNVLGNSSHSNFTMMINGRMTAENSRFYDVSTENEGPYEIGPAQVQQNGSIIKSNTIKFRAIKRPDNYKESSGSEKDNENTVECQLTADKKNIFVGEPLTVTLKIKCLGQIHNLSFAEQITFPGFQIKDDQKAEQRLETKDNKTYQVVEKKFYLIALNPGEQKIKPAKIAYHVPQRQKQRPIGMLDDGFFAGFGGLFDRMQLVQKNAYSNPLAIKILSMPQNQESTDGVGKFTTFKSSVDKSSALLNEAIKLILEIEGEGNFEQIATPKLTLEPYVKSYESKTEFVEDPAMRPFTGKKVFEYIIQVSKAGQVVIPAQKFIYLDTETKTTKTLETKPLTLQITQPEGEAPQYTRTPEKATVYQAPEEAQKNESEISFIEQDGQIMQKNSWTLPWWLMLIALLIPIIFYTQASRNILSKLRTNSIFAKASKRSSLNKLAGDFQNIKVSNKPEQLYSFFLSLLALKFDLNIQEISHDQIIEQLKQSGVEEAKINDFIDFLNECASLHFITTKTAAGQVVVENLFKKSEYWIIVLTK